MLLLRCGRCKVSLVSKCWVHEAEVTKLGLAWVFKSGVILGTLRTDYSAKMVLASTELGCPQSGKE